MRATPEHDHRCGWGNMRGRRTHRGLEIKCRRCKRIHVIPGPIVDRTCPSEDTAFAFDRICFVHPRRIRRNGTMKHSTCCGWAALAICMLLLASPAPASEGGDPRPNAKDCASVSTETVQATQSPCALPDEGMDVIRIPPVVILADPMSRQFENRHDPDFRKYLKQVRKRIDQEKAYPFTAQQMRWEGSAMITFTVSPLGELLQTRVDRTSGFLILDEAAETAVRKAFPVVPSTNLFDHPLEFKVPVLFELH